MSKRTLASSLLAVILLAGLVQHRSIARAGSFAWSSLTIEESVQSSDGNETAQDTSVAPQKKRGNSFVRALGAPFRALSRLLGGGKKNDQQARHISDKDAAKFESSKLTRVKDGRIEEPAATTPSSTNTSFNDHLQRGRELLSTGDLNGAIAELSFATSMKEANSAEAYNLLGIAYQSKGLTQMARSSFEKALKIAKKDPQTLNNLGYLLYVMSDFPGALEFLKKAARLAPNDSRILNNLAMTQSQLGKFDDAAKNFVRAGGEIDGRLNTARRLEIAGRTEEALKNYEAARLRAEAENKANPGAESITVVMEIQNGRVTFASVPNHRPGMEAYEASALRLARQRRYPASKNGQESVVMRVSIIPA